MTCREKLQGENTVKNLFWPYPLYIGAEALSKFNMEVKRMTVTEENGRLELQFDAGSGKARRENVTGVKPAAADQDVYDIASGIANLISDALAGIYLRSVKSYAA